MGIHESTLLGAKPSVQPRLPSYNRDVRWGNFIRLALVLVTLGLAASADDHPATTPLLPCAEGSPGAVSCNPSKKEIKEAGQAFAKGLKLQREKRQDEAFGEFETAARLDPDCVMAWWGLSRAIEKWGKGQHTEALKKAQELLPKAAHCEQLLLENV